MYTNYENRVRDFITEMTNPEEKVVLKDSTLKVLNTREELMGENEMPKPFIFKGYTTEADRIKDTVKNNRYLYNLPDYDKILNPKTNIKSQKYKLPKINIHIDEYMHLKPTTTANDNRNSNSVDTSRLDKSDAPGIYLQKLNLKEKKKFDYYVKNDIILQPQMRFKARTDLERVFDNINGNYLKKDERDILNRQLQSINLFSFKKPVEMIRAAAKTEKRQQEEDKKGYKILPNTLVNIVDNPKKGKTGIYGTGNVYYRRRLSEIKPWIRNSSLNKEAYGMLSQYHKRTHFKAAAEFCENNLLSKNSPKKKANYFAHTTGNSSPFCFDYDLNNENSGIEVNAEETYEKNFNPLVQKETETIDRKKLEQIKQIAEANDPNREEEERKKKELEEEEKHKEAIMKIKDKKNLMDENNVIIGNEIFYKNTQFDLITNKVLGMCNVYHPKSKFNNTSLKARNGKTMITQGMTVSQFEHKYNLPTE